MTLTPMRLLPSDFLALLAGFASGSDLLVAPRAAG